MSKMISRMMERHRQEHLQMTEDFILHYMKTYDVGIDDIKLVERIIHEETNQGFVIRTETHIERKFDGYTTEEEISSREGKGDLRVGLDPAFVDAGSTGKLYCDRCGCWLGRAKQD